MSTYAVSDLHGHLGLYQEIKKFLKPEDKVICLGDCGDRGPQSWETIKAVASDPQWKYLMGNHEHMLIGAMCEYLYDSRVEKFYDCYPDAGSQMILLCASNGGVETLEGWIDNGANPGWINYLSKLDRSFDYDNGQYLIHLTHAGFTPGVVLTPEYGEATPLWNRNHIFDEWPDGHDNEIIVHGHTPAQYFAKTIGSWTPDDRAVFYCGGHKINIDQGTEATHQTLLLDLDTFDEHIFSLEK